MILNNCTTCGRKPEIQVIGLCNYAQCKCGKNVSANKGIWTAEVAADMWNRDNPQVESLRINTGNHMPGDVASHRSPVMPIVSTAAKIEFKKV